MTYQKTSKALARKHLERRLAPLRKASDLLRPPRGWIKAIREALGMTTAQLGKRIGLTQPRVSQIERGEVDGTVTVNTLRQIAEGLNCTFVYALVPNEPLDDMLRERAELIASRQLNTTQHTMRLENQALEPSDLEAARRRLTEELLRGNSTRLWDST